MLSLIVAMDRNRLIGNVNRLPWHLSADLKRFKSITMHKPIVMGRKTYESIGKPLPGRRNIVVSRNPDFQAAGCECVDSLSRAIELTADNNETIIIGGMQIYSLAIPLVQRMYITLIEYEFHGDAWFPEFPEGEWNLVESEAFQHKDKQISYTYQFNILNRARNP